MGIDIFCAPDEAYCIGEEKYKNVEWGDSIREHETTTFEPQNEDSRGYANTFKCTYCGCLVYSAYYMRVGQFDYHFCPYCGKPIVESEEQ